MKRFHDALRQVHNIHTQVEKELGGTMTLTQTGHDVNAEFGTNTFIWKSVGSDDSLVSISYEVREAGDELILQVSGDTVHRTGMDAPQYGETFKEKVHARLLPASPLR